MKSLICSIQTLPSIIGLIDMWTGLYNVQLINIMYEYCGHKTAPCTVSTNKHPTIVSEALCPHGMAIQRSDWRRNHKVEECAKLAARPFF